MTSAVLGSRELSLRLVFCAVIPLAIVSIGERSTETKRTADRSEEGKRRREFAHRAKRLQPAFVFHVRQRGSPGRV